MESRAPLPSHSFARIEGSDAEDYFEHQMLNKSLPTPPRRSLVARLRAWHPQTKYTLPLIMASFSVLEFLRGVDAGASPVLLKGIASDFHSSSTDTYWSGSVYLFAQTACQPVFGGLIQAFGRRLCVTATITTFIVASVLSAVAPNIHWLIGARLVYFLFPDKSPQH